MAVSTPNFHALSESEQREVAERLIKIQESGWKPFWCPDQACSGDPHPLKSPSGARIYVADDAEEGPKGEPVGWEDAEGRITLRKRANQAYKTVVLDPQWAHNHAREDQRLPAWNKPWTLFLMTGRGGGKTRTGVEFVTLSARRGIDGAIIGRRGTELVNTHVAALIENAHPEFMPEYQASKDLIVWPNGAKTFLFSAERPENIRSINVSYAWLDEASHMDEIKTAWMNIKLATRIEVAGNPIHFLITSTPTPTPWTMEMEDDPDVIVRRVSTYANRANLSDDYLKSMEKEYEGTRMGLQELHGQVLRDVDGALWNDSMYNHLRLETPEEFEAFLETMDDIVVAVDPAGSKTKRSDYTAIVAAGRQNSDDGHHRFYVLGATQLKGTPEEWSEATFKMARLVRAHRITVERNFGGDMVKTTLSNHARMNPETSTDENGMDFKIEESRAVKGKETRAEPVVGRYEQGRVVHATSTMVYGDLSELEKEQTTWVPKSRGGRMPSPNLVDACVAEGTMVLMGDGTEKPIEQITSGELVMTRKGPRRATRVWVSRENAEVLGREAAGRTLWATPEHKIWTDTPDEWIRMDSDASVWGNIMVWNTQTQRPALTQWSGWGSSGNSPSEERVNEPIRFTTQPPSKRDGLTVDVPADSTGRSTYTQQETSRKGSTYTTPTSILSTTTQATSSRSHHKSTETSTSPMIQTSDNVTERTGSTTSWPQPLGRNERTHTLQHEQAEQPSKVGRTSESGNESAGSAERSSTPKPKPEREPSFTAPLPVSDEPPVSVNTDEGKTPSSGSTTNVQTAGPSSRSTTENSRKTQQSLAPDPAPSGQRVEPRVWDMEVEEEHEFFANGVLVHNCVWSVTALETAVKYEAQAANRDVLKAVRGIGQRYAS